MQMTIQDTRRENLRKWLSTRTTPAKEKSYFSQLLSGAAPFGERSARRIETTYDLGDGYLDSTDPDNAPRPTRKNPGGISDEAMRLIFEVERIDGMGAPGTQLIASILSIIRAFDALLATASEGRQPSTDPASERPRRLPTSDK